MHPDYLIERRSPANGLWSVVFSCDSLKEEVTKKFLFWKFREKEDSAVASREYLVQKAADLRGTTDDDVRIRHYYWDGIWSYRTIWSNGRWH